MNMTIHILRWLFFVLIFSVFPAQAAQREPIPCGAVWQELSQPWVAIPDVPCLEQVIEQPDAGELAFTALATAPDGTLYAARPLAGEVWAIDDENGDGLPETPRLAAEGLTLPNALTYHDGALYISGGSHIYRLRDGGELTTLVDDLPSGGGFWTGGIAVDDDGYIYIGIGAPCDECVFAQSGRAAILRYDADGANPQRIASGLRYPADMVFDDGMLWVVDSGYNAPDELNRIDVTTTTHLGFPYCVGMGNTPTEIATATGFDCSVATAPVMDFPNGSSPLGMTIYDGEKLPRLTGGMLIVMGGTTNRTELVGYRIVLVQLDETGTLTARSLMPVNPEPWNPVTDFTIEQINYRDSGFWRHRPYDAAVSADGILYVSVGGGRILAMRDRLPKDESEN